MVLTFRENLLEVLGEGLIIAWGLQPPCRRLPGAELHHLVGDSAISQHLDEYAMEHSLPEGTVIPEFVLHSRRLSGAFVEAWRQRTNIQIATWWEQQVKSTLGPDLSSTQRLMSKVADSLTHISAVDSSALASLLTVQTPRPLEEVEDDLGVEGSDALELALSTPQTAPDVESKESDEALGKDNTEQNLAIDKELCPAEHLLTLEP